MVRNAFPPSALAALMLLAAACHESTAPSELTIALSPGAHSFGMNQDSVYCGHRGHRAGLPAGRWCGRRPLDRHARRRGLGHAGDGGGSEWRRGALGDRSHAAGSRDVRGHDRHRGSRRGTHRHRRQRDDPRHGGRVRHGEPALAARGTGGDDRGGPEQPHAAPLRRRHIGSGRAALRRRFGDRGDPEPALPGRAARRPTARGPVQHRLGRGRHRASRSRTAPPCHGTR